MWIHTHTPDTLFLSVLRVFFSHLIVYSIFFFNPFQLLLVFFFSLASSRCALTYLCTFFPDAATICYIMYTFLWFFLRECVKMVFFLLFSFSFIFRKVVWQHLVLCVMKCVELENWKFGHLTYLLVLWTLNGFHVLLVFFGHSFRLDSMHSM